MEYITVPQFKKIQNKQNYKYLQVVDLNGAVVVALNSKVATVQDRMREIETRIPVQKDNVFIVRCKNSLSKNAKVDEYNLVRDLQLAENEPTTIEVIEAAPQRKQRTDVEGVNVRSYEQVLALEIDNKRLELEVERLEDKLELLQEQLSEQIELAEDAPGGNPMFESAQKWLSSTLEMVTPLIDKHFEQKDRKLDLETVKLQHLMKQPGQNLPPSEPVEPVDTRAINFQLEKIQSFVASLNETNEEKAEELKKLYNTAENLDAFYLSVQKFDSAIFDELIQYINA